MHNRNTIYDLYQDWKYIQKKGKPEIEATSEKDVKLCSQK